MKLELNIDFCQRTTSEQQELLNELFAAHDRAARINRNISSAAAFNCHSGSHNIANAIASAALSIGGSHAPVMAARDIYENATLETLNNIIKVGLMVPGFGNSFFKDRLDPSWIPLDTFMRQAFPHIAKRIDELATMMQSLRKKLMPNAALYTAAVCSELRFAPGSEPSVFILARIPAWVSLSLTPEWKKAGQAE